MLVILWWMCCWHCFIFPRIEWWEVEGGGRMGGHILFLVSPTVCLSKIFTVQSFDLLQPRVQLLYCTLGSLQQTLSRGHQDCWSGDLLTFAMTLQPSLTKPGACCFINTPCVKYVITFLLSSGMLVFLATVRDRKGCYSHCDIVPNDLKCYC